MIKNIISVDLEDHFCGLPFSVWNNYESRVVKNTENILNLFKQYKVQATFFTLGYIAEQHPELIEKIVTDGHEIASHSYSHPNMAKMTAKDFESELVKSLKVLEKISGEKILGFRAPAFSITKNNLWAFEILSKYVKYDSSVFPVGPHYGYANAPRHIYKIDNNNPLQHDPDGNLIEIPMATLKLPLLGNFPIAGGIYLRFLPIKFVKIGINKLNKLNFSAMVYIHPPDIDAHRPRLDGTPWHTYVGLENCFSKIESLLKNFSFSSARDVTDL